MSENALMIKCMPEGGYVVAQVPLAPHHGVIHLAAFGVLDDALAFMSRRIRAEEAREREAS